MAQIFQATLSKRAFAFLHKEVMFSEFAQHLLQVINMTFQGWTID
jgi:hypothetical protein